MVLRVFSFLGEALRFSSQAGKFGVVLVFPEHPVRGLIIPTSWADFASVGEETSSCVA